MSKSIQDYAKQALSLMDLTSLTDSETTEDIVELCKQAKSNVGETAAICIFPRFIPIARKQLQAQQSFNVKIATVTNFPHGNEDIDIAVAETKAAIAYGADEVDVVFPYQALINGNETVGFELVKACKLACGEKMLKVIIESGELREEALIRKASEISIAAGADFIKTSTGKVPVNATPEAANIMLDVIKDKNIKVGFKAAGGVRSAEDAKLYLNMAADKLGTDWLTQDHFRFGASSLLASLISTITGDEDTKAPSSNY